MVTRREFNGPEIDDCHHRDVLTAIVSGNVLVEFGLSQLLALVDAGRSSFKAIFAT